MISLFFFFEMISLNQDENLLKQIHLIGMQVKEKPRISPLHLQLLFHGISVEKWFTFIPMKEGDSPVFLVRQCQIQLDSIPIRWCLKGKPVEGTIGWRQSVRAEKTQDRAIYGQVKELVPWFSTIWW